MAYQESQGEGQVPVQTHPWLCHCSIVPYCNNECLLFYTNLVQSKLMLEYGKVLCMKVVSYYTS